MGNVRESATVGLRDSEGTGQCPFASIARPVRKAREFRGQTESLSEIEIRTPYVVAERLIVALMLRFKPAKNVLSDTLRNNP